MRIAYIAAGAAGMYCGSCLHDNTLAAALLELGEDVVLVPTYTPLRTDEANVSIERIFFGGVNVYLQQKSALFRRTPWWLDRLLDHPALLERLARRAASVDPTQLGEMTVSMLRGEAGYQRKELEKLARWLADEIRPDVVHLSNSMQAGMARMLRRRRGPPIVCQLSGEDLFLEKLPPPHYDQARALLRERAADVDAFVAVNRYYADFMADYLGIPAAKFHITPLGIDTGDFVALEPKRDEPDDRPPRVGYLARLAPEKGLHVLVDAFLALRRLPGMERAELHVAGWLGEHRRKYAEEQFDKLRAAGLGDALHYAGSVDRHGKVEFLRQLDVLSVPTVYREPKGLFVLEALAMGVPVVQPNHGAFPELIEWTGGGRLVRPEDPAHLALVLHELLTDHAARRELGRCGRESVLARFNADAMAQQALELYAKHVPELLPSAVQMPEPAAR